MSWCELCRDHYDASHWDEDAWPPEHKSGPAYGPTGAQLVRSALVDRVIGPDAVLWSGEDDGTFEVRRGGKHVGFLAVSAQGEVSWR